MVAQLLANVLITSSIIVAVAVGFAIIFETTRFFHFAHGAVFTLGAYFTYAFNKIASVPLEAAFLLAMGASAAIGCGLEIGVYRPLRRKGGSPLVLLLASLGLFVLLQNVVGLVFGDDTQSIRSNKAQESIEVLGARVTPIQIVIITVSVLLVSLTYLFVKRTKAGKAMRAVANDPELAMVSGIETERVVLCVFAIGSALAGAAGTLVALDVDMTPTMGLNPLMLGVVAVIVGGRGSFIGIALGALLIGLAQQLGGWWLGSQWQNTMAFIVLLGFLVARPRGFLGRELPRGAG